MSPSTVILYSTTFAATLKTRSDITKIKHILDSKKIPYDDARVSFCVHCLIQHCLLKEVVMINGGNLIAAVFLLQVDLSEEPHRRVDMLKYSDNNHTLPQLHVNNRFIGKTD